MPLNDKKEKKYLFIFFLKKVKNLLSHLNKWQKNHTFLFDLSYFFNLIIWPFTYFTLLVKLPKKLREIVMQQLPSLYTTTSIFTWWICTWRCTWVRPEIIQAQLQLTSLLGLLVRFISSIETWNSKTQPIFLLLCHLLYMQWARPDRILRRLGEWVCVYRSRPIQIRPNSIHYQKYSPYLAQAGL